MDFKQLRSFTEVIDQGSFTLAAKSLHFSQPTVSMHVKMLEEEIGTPLVLRTAKRVGLTQAGQKVYEQAQSILAMHDRMVAIASPSENELVYFGASSIPSSYILPDDLAAFRQTNPSAKFVIHQADSQAVVANMVEGLYDIGFTGIPADEDSIACVPFCSDRMVLATANTPHFAGLVGKASAREVLAREDVIMRRAGSGTRAVVDRILEEEGVGEEGLNVVARLNDLEAIKNLVERGFGVSLLSERTVRDRVEAGKMIAFEIDDVDVTREFYLLRRKNVELNSNAQSFAAFVRLRHGLDEQKLTGNSKPLS